MCDYLMYDTLGVPEIHDSRAIWMYSIGSSLVLGA